MRVSVWKRPLGVVIKILCHARHITFDILGQSLLFSSFLLLPGSRNHLWGGRSPRRTVGVFRREPESPVVPTSAVGRVRRTSKQGMCVSRSHIPHTVNSSHRSREGTSGAKLRGGRHVLLTPRGGSATRTYCAPSRRPGESHVSGRQVSPLAPFPESVASPFMPCHLCTGTECARVCDSV